MKTSTNSEMAWFHLEPHQTQVSRPLRTLSTWAYLSSTAKRCPSMPPESVEANVARSRTSSLGACCWYSWYSWYYHVLGIHCHPPIGTVRTETLRHVGAMVVSKYILRFGTTGSQG